MPEKIGRLSFVASETFGKLSKKLSAIIGYVKFKKQKVECPRILCQ